MAKNNKKYKVGKSSIQGDGAFAKQNLQPGEYIGKVHTILQPYVDYEFTELGRKHNHSDNPNVQNVLIGNERHLMAIKPIKKGEELKSNYRLQPDLEQPEDFEKAKTGKKLSPSKAREILHDKSVHGHPLTDKQRRFFGAIAGGAPIKAEQGSWLDKYDDGGPVQENYNNYSISTPPEFVGMGNNTQGRNYSPAWGGQFAMGGSLPGSVGFTYARTQGSAPSEGPYAKKTLPSAQGGTKLTKAEEKKYQSWRSNLPKNLQYEGDYDLRGLWKENPKVKPSPNLHFPDTYKLPNHPTFSNESKYYDSFTPGVGGYWGEGEENFIKNPQIGPPIPHAENGMSYYQHGLDWKPRNISRDGSLIPIAQTGDIILPKYKMPRATSESTSTGVTSLQRNPELERQIDITKELAKQPRIPKQSQIKQGRKSTPREEAERRRKNEVYASTLPNARYNEQTGEIERINPNRSITGEAENIISRKEDQKAEDALRALEIAGALEGVGALGSLARKAAIESTKTGLLSNAHRVNPFAGTFAGESKLPSWLQLNKLDDANAYWRLTKDPEKYGIYEGAYFNKGVPLTGDLANTFEKGSRPWMHRYSGLMYNPETGQMNRYFGPDYLFKVTDPSKMEPFLKFPEPHLRFFRSTEAMSPNSPGVTQFKKDWLQGWKEVPKQRKGGVVKDNMGYWNLNNWGKVVEIDSPDIKMQGVYEPLEGISKQTGERKVMLPGKDYTFANTKQVIEKPLNKKSTGGWLDKYN